MRFYSEMFDRKRVIGARGKIRKVKGTEVIDIVLDNYNARTGVIGPDTLLRNVPVSQYRLAIEWKLSRMSNKHVKLFQELWEQSRQTA